MNIINTFLNKKTKEKQKIKTTYNYNRYISARWKIYQTEEKKQNFYKKKEKKTKYKIDSDMFWCGF